MALHIVSPAGRRSAWPYFTALLGASYSSSALLACALILAALLSRLHWGLHYPPHIMPELVIRLGVAMGIMVLWRQLRPKK